MSIPTDRPAYRITNVDGFFGPNDHLYGEGECIVFDDEPNEHMEPLNELARARLTVYLEKLDKLAEVAAEKAQRPFVGRPRTLDGALILAKQDEAFKMKVRGADKDVTSIESVEPEPIPEVGNANPKRKPGRPPYKNKAA